MRYSNQTCDGCGKLFTENDEIVVCPECATPQHRECYNENKHCVNFEKHAEGFTWQNEGALNTPAANEEKARLIPCPNCGYENPEGTEVCRQCSMKFTLFGFNVVEAAANEEEKRNTEASDTNNNIPVYNAPFTLGKGDGFDNQPVFTQDTFSDPHSGEESGRDFTEAPEPAFPGPFSAKDKTFGISTNLLGAVIGQNGMKYITKFKALEAGKRISFNWAAFFFSPYWFFYRKMIRPGIVFSTLYMCLSIVSTPTILKFYDIYLFIAENASAVTESEFIAQLTELENLYPPMLLFMGIQFLLHLAGGFMADKMYKNRLVSTIYTQRVSPLDKGSVIQVIKAGGVSPLFALMAVCAENIVSSIAGMLM